MHNAQVTAAHVRVSQALQRALLPRALPVVPGMDLAAEYLPASTGSDVGGDFYDVYPVGPAQLAGRDRRRLRHRRRRRGPHRA